MSKLAINGGKPVRTKLFPNQCVMGEEEKQAVKAVMDSGKLTGYQASAKNFHGGPEIQKLIEAWKEQFGSQYVIPCNSCTSGLHIACGAIGLDNSSEVLVTPYSMTCSATAPMIYNADVNFVDVEKDYFNIDPAFIKKHFIINDKIYNANAVIAVDIFGQAYHPDIDKIAKENGMYIIEDAAQAFGAKRNGKWCGTLGDIGVYSLNQGKHITSGEGGIIVTDNEELALKCQLIMNHAESVVNDWMPHANKINYDSYIKPYANLVGFNMRMTEIQAAIARVQLGKFFDNELLEWRIQNAEFLNYRLSQIPAISAAKVRPGSTHSYYCQAFLFDQEVAGVHRDKFINAVKAELTPLESRENEGVRIGSGYIKPLYRMPVFDDHNINPADFPVVEKLWKDELFLHLYVAYPTTFADLGDIARAFGKVWDNRKEIK